VLGRGLIPTDELIASGLPVEIHDQLRYRNVTAEEAKELTGYNIEGWVIPYCAPNGDAYQHEGRDFFRLKPAYPGNGAKYLSPKGSGCRPYWSPLFGEPNLTKGKPWLVTEGEKKTDCLNHNGFPTIGLPGVTSWKDKRSGESQPLPELMSLDWRRKITIVFDSDLTIKPELQAALQSLCEWIASKAGYPFVPNVVQLPYEQDGSKNGPDDFIVRHGVTAFQRLIKIAQPSGEWRRDPETKRWIFDFEWQPEPSNVHYIATPFSTVLKESFAEHPQFGTYGWQGTHWERLDERNPLRRPIHDLMDIHEFHTRGNGRINSIVDETAAYLRQANWDQPNLVAFSNGTLDLVTGILRKGHYQNDRLTFCFPFAYDPSAECPRWEKFLAETYVKADGSQDPQIVKVIRAAIRWTICPKDLGSAFPYEKSFDVGGPKGCGKGVTMEVIRALCGGTHGAGTLRSKMFGDPDSMASLLNKKAAIDADASGIVLDPGSFNSIVSNEPVQIWIKYKNKCDARLGCVIWRFYNDQPRVADDGGVEGMARRIITFSIPFSVEKKDPHLKTKLMAELPGIYQWAMGMTEADMAEAFSTAGEIDSLRQGSIDAQLDANPWLRFLVDEFPYGTKNHGARLLHKRYVEWAEAQRMKGIYTETSFGKKLRRMEGYRSTINKRSTSGGLVYDISPMKDVDLAHFFGLKSVSAGSNHPPVDSSSTNPPPADPSASNASQGIVDSVDSLSRPFHERQKKGDQCVYKKSVAPNPPHPPLTTVTDRVKAAMADGCRAEDAILKWCADRKLALARTECRRALKRLQSDSQPL
jgi:putative DNA primase/helicase